jgi:hypothetical protein
MDTNAMSNPNQCPFCDYIETKDETHWHSIPEMNRLLNQKMIPVSKIEAKIKQREKQLPECDGWTTTENMIGMIIKELKDLLPPQAKAKKEKEKPEE